MQPAGPAGEPPPRRPVPSPFTDFLADPSLRVTTVSAGQQEMAEGYGGTDRGQPMGMELLGDDSGAPEAYTERNARVAAQRELEEAMVQVERMRLEVVHMESELRQQEQHNRVQGWETSRLRQLVSDLQEQHQRRANEAAKERESLQHQLKLALMDKEQAEEQVRKIDEELAVSFRERESLTNVLGKLRREVEEQLHELHKAQDAADEWQMKYEREVSERESDAVEIKALRATLQCQEEYGRSVAKQRDKLQEYARKMHVEMQQLYLTSQDSGVVAPPVPPRSPSPPPDERPASPPPQPLHHPTPQHHTHHPQPPPHSSPHPSFGHLSPIPFMTPPPPIDSSPETYDDRSPSLPPEYIPLDDPLSPTLRRVGDDTRAVPFRSPSEAGVMSPNHKQELARLHNRIDRLATELTATKVEDRSVQQDYLLECVARLNGAHTALENLCAVITDWSSDVNAGRGPWGSAGEPNEDVSRMRRQRDADRRAEMKKEISRALARSGVDDSSSCVLEVYFGAGRVRDAVTVVMEAFQLSRSAADAKMAGAKRVIEASLETAKAQAGGMNVALEDAQRMGSQIRELTDNKVEAQQHIETLERQVRQLESYQNEVERIAERLKAEAQEEREKVGEIIEQMSAKQKAEVATLQEHHMKNMKETMQTHAAEVGKLKETIQELRDTEEQLRKEIVEKNKQIDSCKVKRKSYKNAREALESEKAELKQALAHLNREGKAMKDRHRTLEKENAVLRDLTAKLESEVRRGRIVLEGEAERTAFAAWRKSKLPGTVTEPSPARTRHATEASRDDVSTAAGRCVEGSRHDWVYYQASASSPRSLKPSSFRPFLSG